MKGEEVERVKEIEPSALLKLREDSLWQCATREGCEKSKQAKYLRVSCCRFRLIHWILGLLLPLQCHEVGHDVGELSFVEQDVHRRHGAGAEFVESFSQLRRWVDQTFVDVGAVFTTGDAVHCRTYDAPFIAYLVTAHTGGNSVFVEDVLAALGQA